MTSESLAAAITRAGSPVTLMRNQNWPAFTFPVAPEFTNWRDEQRAWNSTVALMDQSHHMTQLFLGGADLIPMLSSISPNTFGTFRPGVAKQLISVNKDGYLIGDGILFYNEDAPEGLVLIGHHLLIDWVRFNAEKAQAAGKDVHHRLEGNSHMRQGPPTFYRYELQGPQADVVMEKVFGGPAPDIKFFHIGDVEIAGRPVKALRHGMAGQPGFEFYGPWEDNEIVLNALMEAGAEHGIRRVGAKAYSATPLESGWVPTPFPAIFDEDFAEYREWLPADRAGSIGGSLFSEDIHDYYMTPYDLGLGRSVRFDHDFHGREALEKLAESPKRRKVTLLWNANDVADVVRSQMEPGIPAKFLDFPKARYGLYQMDEVLLDGRRVGISTDAGYIAYDQLYMSLATLDADIADGEVVEVVWGEDPISQKHSVDAQHRQVRIRATVAPAPYHEYARTVYRADD
ncbi:MAG: aminomethyl transferase family protein [Actinobacteria bacterium]|uniref:aminomethyl transferase family protein n=1 Tax=Microbacterium sp. TaxID=51671 RepID=UPI000C5C1A42|nr:aminomethyl transferase family protein [Microbacterium sp.]MBU19342.1 glycine cleavage system protein T [Microbacterium sp.]RUA27804.1 MAG: aminomethyl transferase family protein [Actinomycetota bacterium]HIE61394.1 aminomethyl transferase family protein [Microbacterium sp.]